MSNYIEVAKETMLGDLMKCLVEQIKVCPKSWQQMSEREQQEALDRMELQVSSAVRQVVNIVLSENKIAVVAKIESVTYKDGCKAVLKAVGDIENTIHLAEAEGKCVNIIIPQTDDMLNGDGKPQAEPDQRGLELGEEYSDADPEGDISDFEEDTDLPDDDMPGDDDQEDDEESDEFDFDEEPDSGVDPLYESVRQYMAMYGRSTAIGISAKFKIELERAREILDQLKSAGLLADGNDGVKLYLMPKEDVRIEEEEEEENTEDFTA